MNFIALDLVSSHLIFIFTFTYSPEHVKLWQQTGLIERLHTLESYNVVPQMKWNNVDTNCLNSWVILPTVWFLKIVRLQSDKRTLSNTSESSVENLSSVNWLLELLWQAIYDSIFCHQQLFKRDCSETSSSTRQRSERREWRSFMKRDGVDKDEAPFVSVIVSVK